MKRKKIAQRRFARRWFDPDRTNERNPARPRPLESLDDWILFGPRMR